MKRLVAISEPHYLTVVGIWLAMQIGIVFLVYPFLENLLKPGEPVRQELAHKNRRS